MKALSILPEWAMPILQGIKTVECRSWKTDYRGDLLICSSSKSFSGTISGHALCVVNLEKIEPFSKKHLKSADMEGFDCPENSYAWIFNELYLIEPFKVKGKLHLYDVDDSLIKYQTEQEDTREFLEKHYLPLIHYSKKYEAEDRMFINQWINSFK